MTKKQKRLIALMCALALVLAGLILWRQPAAPAPEGPAGHAGHADTHGHDDRHAGAGAAGNAAEAERGIALTAAQIRSSGIVVAAAGPALIQERLHLSAQLTVDAERSVALAAPAAGVVETVRVPAGSTVTKGQTLVLLRSPEVAQWRAELGSAQARLQLARSTHEREQSLWRQGISARQDADAAHAAFREAEFAVQAARQRLRALGIGAGAEASGSVAIAAPFAGVVLDKPAVTGQSVDARTPLLTLADLSRVWVEAALPADSLAQVAAGMPAKVSVGASPGQLEGTVSFVGPVLGEATRMATARIALPNPGLRLRPGMLASVDLLGQAANVPVTVASEAVQTIHEHPVVFVRTASGFRTQDVTLGRSDGKRTEIVQGLAAGTPYAAAGSFVLKADLGKADAEHED
jgi:cobalt-zinc-cadmium efflux system membrane fusion protein